MADGILIEIVSPERLLLSEQVQSVTVPGSEGYFTVMGDHAPLMTTLKPGFITVNGPNGAQTFYVRGGFADVSPAGLTILAEQASGAGDFDRAEIEQLLSEAREALATAEGFDDKNFAQEMVDGWVNLMAEAEHMRVSQSHAA